MTSEKIVLDYIRKYGSITVRMAAVDLSINSPTKVLSNIRKLGYPLTEEWHTNPITGRRYKVYRLSEHHTAYEDT